MHKLVINDLMNIIEYEKVRNEYREELMLYKKNRRISLGPNITITFENRRTMTFQIQEIMRAERLVHDENIQEEIDVYNSLLPQKNSLSATLFIEVTEKRKIKPILNQFIGLTEGDTLFLEIGGKKIFAEFEAGREESDKISSVHYVQFSIKQELIPFFKNDEDIKLKIDYKEYSHSQLLSNNFKLSLFNDLAGNNG
tara:strand:- start:891 stop:1481 length:591 start_codon:yes stop_codon:yes gene_type:complete